MTLVASAPVRAAAHSAEERIDRVVVISDDLSPSGGAGAVARESLFQLTRQGLSVTALVGIAAGAEGLPSEVDLVPVDGGELRPDSGLRAAIGGVYDASVRARVARWVEDNDTPGTIYHLHNWHKSLSPAVFPALRRVERRLLLTAHDYFLVCPNGAFYNFRSGRACELSPMSAACLGEQCDKRRYLHKAWRALRQGVRSGLYPLPAMQSHVLAPHEGVTPYLMRGGVPAGKIRVIRNPVAPWTDHRVEAETQNLVLFVGRVEADKGAHIAAEAAERCGVALTVVGDGPLLPELAARYPRHRFLGRKTRAQIAGLAAQTRLLVVAPLWPETFGLVTFEGLMSGCPTLLSQEALVAEPLRRLDAVEIFNPADADATAALMARLLRDPARLAELSVNGFALRHSYAPSPEAWGRKLTRLYRALLADAREG